MPACRRSPRPPRIVLSAVTAAAWAFALAASAAAERPAPGS
jgi:hypothetical protein